MAEEAAEEPGAEPAENRRPDGTFGPGNNAGPKGRAGKKKDLLAELRAENEELKEKLAERGAREENKVLKARVKELEARAAELETLLAERDAEIGRLKGGEAVDDPGTDAALGLIEKLLAEAAG